MALLLVMTVCLLVDAALESRIRMALKAPQATVPNQTGQPIQNPTARWVFPYCVGIHLRLIPGDWPLVLNLTETRVTRSLLTILELISYPLLVMRCAHSFKDPVIFRMLTVRCLKYSAVMWRLFGWLELSAWGGGASMGGAPSTCSLARSDGPGCGSTHLFAAQARPIRV
jgi:hypothetical protein